MANAASRIADQAKGTGLAPAEGAPKSLLEWLRDPAQQAELATSLPRQIGIDRFVRVIVTLIKTSPALMECSRESVLGAMLRAGQLGLEPGPLGLSYLIPYNNRLPSGVTVKECQLQIGYRGYIDLARRSGQLASIEAHTVYEGDKFEWQYGTDKYLHHRPCAPSARGMVTHYYGLAQFTNGGSNFEVLWPETIEEHRAMSKMPNSPAWRDHFESMALKTCIRVMARWLPMTFEAREAIAQDETTINLGDLVGGSIDTTAIEADTPPATAPEPGNCPECGATDGQAHEPSCSKG